MKTWSLKGTLENNSRELLELSLRSFLKRKHDKQSNVKMFRVLIKLEYIFIQVTWYVYITHNLMKVVFFWISLSNSRSYYLLIWCEICTAFVVYQLRWMLSTLRYHSLCRYSECKLILTSYRSLPLRHVFLELGWNQPNYWMSNRTSLLLD